MEASFVEAGELLISTYLPGEKSIDKDNLEVDEFLSLCSKAIYARSMRRDDIKSAIMEAVSELFGN